jgi:hypothetical protein
MIREAMVFHYLDDMDSKMAAVRAALAARFWRRRMVHLQRRPRPPLPQTRRLPQIPPSHQFIHQLIPEAKRCSPARAIGSFRHTWTYHGENVCRELGLDLALVESVNQVSARAQ